MDNKPTVLYSAGTYGAYLLRVLNHNVIRASEAYHHSVIFYKYTQKNFNQHHTVKEGEIDTPVIKITYDDDDISLINRNKWTKVKGHLEEQSQKMFPNNPNKELYIMAVHICLLLNPNNHSRYLEKNNNFEFKFKWFLSGIDIWLKKIMRCCERFNIPYNEQYFTESHKKFLVGQQDILDKNNENNDLIAKSKKIGDLYFKKYHLHFRENLFDKLLNNLNKEDTW